MTAVGATCVRNATLVNAVMMGVQLVARHELRIRDIDFRLRVRGHRRLVGVLDHTDDGHDRVRTAIRDLQLLPQRILAAEILPNEGLIHDRGGSSSGPIRFAD